MKYNPEIHHRKSIRLKGYDYSKSGAYFITICTQHRECRFGEIIDEQLFLNDAGNMIEDCWLCLTNIFPDIELDEFIVMPNHFHGIIFIYGTDDKFNELENIAVATNNAKAKNDAGQPL